MFIIIYHRPRPGCAFAKVSIVRVFMSHVAQSNCEHTDQPHWILNFFYSDMGAGPVFVLRYFLLSMSSYYLSSCKFMFLLRNYCFQSYFK